MDFNDDETYQQKLNQARRRVTMSPCKNEP